MEERKFDDAVWGNNVQKLEAYAEFHRTHPHCTTPRLWKETKLEFAARTGNVEIDENYPGMLFSRNRIAKVVENPQFAPKYVGIDANFREVNQKALEVENELRYAKSNQHGDPWWNKSVAERMNERHTKQRWKIIKVYSDPNKAYKPNLKLLQKDEATPIRSHLEVMNDLAVSDRRIREKISPFYVPISSNYFTKNGNNLGDFNKIQVIKKADAALDVIHQEEDKEGAMSEGAMSEGQDRRGRGEGCRKGNKTKKGISATSMALLRLFHTFKTELGGEEKLEEIGNEFVDYAEKIRERRTKPIFDVGLDFADACLKGKSFQVIPMLLFGADPNSLTHTGEPVLWAVFNKVLAMDMVRTSTLTDEELLHVKDRVGYMKVLDALVKHGASLDPDAPDNTEKLSLLHLTAISGNANLTRWGVANGAKLSKKDYYDRTPLMIAAKIGNVEISAELLKAGVNVNETDSKAWTALHYAASTGQTRLALFLLKLGSKKHLPSKDNIVASELATINGFTITSNAIAGFGLRPTPAEEYLDYFESKLNDRPKEIGWLSDTINWIFGDDAAPSGPNDTSKESRNIFRRMFNRVKGFMTGMMPLGDNTQERPRSALTPLDGNNRRKQGVDGMEVSPLPLLSENRRDVAAGGKDKHSRAAGSVMCTPPRDAKKAAWMHSPAVVHPEI